MISVHAFVSGFVQGVGYRQFVRKQAEKLGLTGWVQNLPDGRVEYVAQGDKTKLEELISRCRQGPFLAEVKDIAVTWQDESDPFTGFQIRQFEL
jgi:acylphosphatase